MDLFDFIKEMVKPVEFKKIGMHERAKHFFMVNRLCSIKYPIQASYFNHLRINPGQAVTFWQSLLSSQYKRTPEWMYVKTKKDKDKKKAAQPVSDEIIKKYCAAHKISMRDINDALEIFGDDMWSELQKFEEMLGE